VTVVDVNLNGLPDENIHEIVKGGNLARIEHPDGAVERFRYNEHGQETHHVRAEGGVVDLSEYYPENKPNGIDTTPAPGDGRTLGAITGGHLKATRRDAPPPQGWPPAGVPGRTHPASPVDALTEH
jgi:YD repeat-containing protein